MEALAGYDNEKIWNEAVEEGIRAAQKSFELCRGNPAPAATAASSAVSDGHFAMLLALMKALGVHGEESLDKLWEAIAPGVSCRE